MHIELNQHLITKRKICPSGRSKCTGFPTPSPCTSGTNMVLAKYYQSFTLKKQKQSLLLFSASLKAFREFNDQEYQHLTDFREGSCFLAYLFFIMFKFLISNYIFNLEKENSMELLTFVQAVMDWSSCLHLLPDLAVFCFAAPAPYPASLVLM